LSLWNERYPCLHARLCLHAGVTASLIMFMLSTEIYSMTIRSNFLCNVVSTWKYVNQFYKPSHQFKAVFQTSTKILEYILWHGNFMPAYTK
jgi:hypothetical protein